MKRCIYRLILYTNSYILSYLYYINYLLVAGDAAPLVSTDVRSTSLLVMRSRNRRKATLPKTFVMTSASWSWVDTWTTVMVPWSTCSRRKWWRTSICVVGDLGSGGVVLVDNAWTADVDTHRPEQHVEPDQLLHSQAQCHVLRLARPSRH